MMKKIRIVLAEDHHVVRAAVATFLNKEADIEVVGEVGEAGDLLDRVQALQPDVLVLDAHMPGQKVTKAAQAIKTRYPNVRILVLSAYDRREYVVGLLRAGAAGYVLKDDPPDMLLRAVRAVIRGEEYVSPRVAQILVQSVRGQDERPISKLTERELDVLRLMAAGHKNEEIAGLLFVTTQTVKNHISSIFRKLEVDSRVEAVLYAINEGLATSPRPDDGEPA
jgi:DNA-binding NarL/FixJ family response regulator